MIRMQLVSLLIWRYFHVFCGKDEKFTVNWLHGEKWGFSFFTVQISISGRAAKACWENSLLGSDDKSDCDVWQFIVKPWLCVASENKWPGSQVLCLYYVRCCSWTRSSQVYFPSKLPQHQSFWPTHALLGYFQLTVAYIETTSIKFEHAVHFEDPSDSTWKTHRPWT